jgi:hypothetical protein
MKINFFSILIFLVFLISCSGGTVVNPTKPNPNDAQIFKGTDGLFAEFTKGNPPQTTYASSEGKAEFAVSLNYENKGAADIKNGILNLLIERDYVKFQQDSGTLKNFQLKGKTAENPVGEYKSDTYYLEAQLDENSVGKKTQISALFCYDYETNAAFPVCIDTDILNRKLGEKACAVKDETSVGQGAPVVVTRVETRMMPKENGVTPSFLIHISNKGSGMVLNPSHINAACSSEAKNKDMWNQLNVEATLGIDNILNCNPKILHLRGNDDFVKCDSDKIISSSESTYLGTLKVNLKYGYTFTQSKTVEIKRI